jgi:SAM-dependent methyltransferase
LEIRRAKTIDEELPDVAKCRIQESEAASPTSRDQAFKLLRSLSLTDFGMFLLSLPNPKYPRLSSLLPSMASTEVQNSWTGDHGIPLLTQSIDFVRSLACQFPKLTGHGFEDASILDFGCGYGRILRLMYFFSDENSIFGVDPWDRSIEICLRDGLRNIFLSEYLPSSLPLPRTDFDLIFAFSVFTHLSEKATAACLKTLAQYVSRDGMIVITIRPVKYWDFDRNATARRLVDNQKQTHMKHGFAFLPHDRTDGLVNYGDTSMSLDWLQASFPELRIVAVDRSLSDPGQLYVYLQKR